MKHNDYEILRCSSKAASLLFVLGMFSVTQITIVGKIGISEFLMCIVAPFVYMKNQLLYRQDKVNTILILAFLWCAGTIVADSFAGTPFVIGIKGLATPAVVLAMLICIYPLLRKNPDGLKWLVCGFAVSMIINIFIFQPGGAGNYAAEYGLAAGAASVMEYKLFWVQRADAVLGSAVRGWYMNLPVGISIMILTLIAGVALYVGGRSAFFMPCVSLVLVLIMGRNVFKMKSMRRYSMRILLIFMLASLGAFYGYKMLTIYGVGMKDAEHERERAVKQGDKNVKNKILALLMGGRAEVFIGLIAAFDKPIIGHGTYAADTKGYRQDFMLKYGNEDDIKLINNMIQSGNLYRIPAHSHIVQSWMCHGVFGLMFWLYVIVLLVNTLRLRMGVIPQYFGYLAMELPAAAWNIPFSPFGNRPFMVTLICVALLLRAIDNDNKRMLRR